MTVLLNGTELALLREVHASDEDHGGLHGGELVSEDFEPMNRLLELGLVEAMGEYGEAPDGEEDEREMGATRLIYRVTASGVTRLREE